MLNKELVAIGSGAQLYAKKTTWNTGVASPRQEPTTSRGTRWVNALHFAQGEQERWNR
ncbi:hypothetical protein Pcac1_g16159 [Phytophthora cactorum]|nr:hypothetical protein Pcac1_g16159 [Phytophthora cactorum]